MMCSMRLLVALLLLLLASIDLSIAADFNVFKSYANEAVKPPQYSANLKRKRHPINEYLTTRQQTMMTLRKQNAPAGYMFNEKWSGFDAAANANIKPIQR